MQRKDRLRSRATRSDVHGQVRAILKWFRLNARDLPWRRSHDPYSVWVSEIMLQQTQVKTVIPYWERWMRELPTLRSLARARWSKVLKLWEGLGYYARARNLHQAAKYIVRERSGRFPTAFDDLLALPGIGRYTAGAICSIAFDQPTPVLDGNVTRLLSRVLGTGKASASRLWRLAEQLVRTAAGEPPQGRRNSADLNQALMELGAVMCTPRHPRCPACPLKRYCTAFRDPAQHAATSQKKRARPTRKHLVAFVAERNGRFLVQQRPAKVVNGQLWEFPNAEAGAGSAACQRAMRGLFGLRGQKVERLLSVKHSITRYRVTLDVYRLAVGQLPIRLAARACWCSQNQLGRLAFPSAHRRIIDYLQNDGKPQPPAS